MLLLFRIVMFTLALLIWIWGWGATGLAAINEEMALAVMYFIFSSIAAGVLGYLAFNSSDSPDL